MRLTDGQVKDIKVISSIRKGYDNNNINVSHQDVVDLCDTIEALQQDLDDLKLEINMQVGGEHAKIFAHSLIQFFKQNGGQNFVTTTGLLGSEKYEITVRKCDGKTPGEKMSELAQEIDQHIHWNATQNERLIGIYEENKKLKEALSQARQALEYSKSYYHPEVIEFMKKHKGCDFNTILLDFIKKRSEETIAAIDKIGGGQSEKDS